MVLHRSVISAGLAAQWRLSQQLTNQIDQREGEICIGCGSSLRVRQLATAIADWLTQKGCPRGPTRESVGYFSALGMKVAELNACGELHNALRSIAHLAYSEYQPTTPGIPHEDLLALSYPDNTFDLVIHSDTLEHVPDVHTALNELYRVLKPGGSSIFTVPMVPDGRRTRVRAVMDHGKIIYLEPASYHGGSQQQTQQYLVYYEFGSDFLQTLHDRGFRVTTASHPQNPLVMAITATKPLGTHD